MKLALLAYCRTMGCCLTIWVKYRKGKEQWSGHVRRGAGVPLVRVDNLETEEAVYAAMARRIGLS